MRLIYALFRETFLLLLMLSSLFVLLCASLTIYLTPQLPDVTTLKDYKLQTPLKIFTSDGKLITEYGDQRRTPLEYHEIPELFVKALIAIEDNRFEYHKGMDPIGFIRAATCFIQSGNCGGGSTLTQQVAKNVYLTRDQTFRRKFTEIILALKMEALLSKEDIFELYVNKHFLGHRAYGIEAAANVYYNRTINELTLPELAMIAGLNQSPSRKNPFTNPAAALERRNLVLKRMLELNFITQASYDWAIAQPNTANRMNNNEQTVEALYAAEEVRAALYAQHGEAIYQDGFHVFTTIDSKLQRFANTSLRYGLLDYSERHGYRGPAATFTLANPLDKNALLIELSQIDEVAELTRAIVIGKTDQTVQLLTANEQEITLSSEAWSWAAAYIDIDTTGDKPTNSDLFTLGDVIYIRQNEGKWLLTQPHSAQGALVAIDPFNGDILAMSGGYDYSDSKFNRASQAKRQPGSNIKPFIYAAALEKGYSAATLINDAPVNYSDDKLETTWRPKNSGNKYLGEIPLRQALYQSRNASSVRILSDIGIGYAIGYLQRLGFDTSDFAKDLSMILGTNEMSPLHVAKGYALFANGGFDITPHLIKRIEDHQGNLIFEDQSAVACRVCLPSQTQAKQVMNSDTAFIMDSILKDVITRGTATAARTLERKDIAGKTGTTNSQIDAWFTGYHPSIVVSTWVGFDSPLTLGAREFGGRAALPIWIDFMRQALQNTPETISTQPAGVVRVKIDPKTGLLATPDHDNAIFEWFRQANAPTEYSSRNSGVMIFTEEDSVTEEDYDADNSDQGTSNEPSKVEIITSPDLLF